MVSTDCCRLGGQTHSSSPSCRSPVHSVVDLKKASSCRHYCHFWIIWAESFLYPSLFSMVFFDMDMDKNVLVLPFPPPPFGRDPQAVWGYHRTPRSQGRAFPSQPWRVEARGGGEKKLRPTCRFSSSLFFFVEEGERGKMYKGKGA